MKKAELSESAFRIFAEIRVLIEEACFYMFRQLLPIILQLFEKVIPVKYWDLEVWDLGPNGLYLLFSLALNTYLREHTYYDTSNHDL